MTYEPPQRRSVLDDQMVYAAGARELQRRGADVVRSVTDGTRTVLTRHGEPQAVIVSIRDWIELLAEARVAALDPEAARDFREGAVEPIEPPGPYAVVLAREAASAYARMKASDRRALRTALVRGLADERRLLWLRSRRWVVAFAYPDPETVLVTAAFEARELERELIGEELYAAQARRNRARRLHARDLTRLPP